MLINSSFFLLFFVKELPQFTAFEFSLLQKIHRQRFTVPGLRERMSQAHLFGPFRLHSGLHFISVFHAVRKGIL